MLPWSFDSKCVDKPVNATRLTDASVEARCFDKSVGSTTLHAFQAWERSLEFESSFIQSKTLIRAELPLKDGVCVATLFRAD